MSPRQDNSQRKVTRNRRAEGAPCLCTNKNHGHDEEGQCGHPVFGRTRSGRIKFICDHCSYLAWLVRNPQSDPKVRHPTRTALKKARLEAEERADLDSLTPTSREGESSSRPPQPRRPKPSDPGDDILREPF